MTPRWIFGCNIVLLWPSFVLLCRNKPALTSGDDSSSIPAPLSLTQTSVTARDDQDNMQHLANPTDLAQRLCDDRMAAREPSQDAHVDILGAGDTHAHTHSVHRDHQSWSIPGTEHDSTYTLSNADNNNVPVTLSTATPGGADVHFGAGINHQYLRETYDTVRASGMYNFAGARRRVPSGLNIGAWREYFKDYKDPYLVEYLEFGWPINFNRVHTLRAAQGNHFSAEAYPEHVTYYIDTELTHEALLGPFEGPPVIDIHTRPLMTKVKKNSPHRRVIVDLSFPHGWSVNDGIHPTLHIDFPLTVKLPTVHSMEQCILELGPGSYLYKSDLACGYRQLRVDPGDWGLLAFRHGRVPPLWAALRRNDDGSYYRGHHTHTR